VSGSLKAKEVVCKDWHAFFFHVQSKQVSLLSFEDPENPHETNNAAHYYQRGHDYGKILQPVKI